MNNYNKNVKIIYSNKFIIIIILIFFQTSLLSYETNINNIETFRVDENQNEIPINQLDIEIKLIENVKPLLNFIFFDFNSAEIPKKYNLLEEGNKINFNVNNLFYADNISAYYQILNIIGQRMQNNPKSKITLVGCSSPDEKDKKNLAVKRANTIKNYLVNVWKIESKRIITKIQLNPVNSANEKLIINDKFYFQRMEENRRVEIYEQDNGNSIISPVSTFDTITFSDPNFIRFKFNISNIDSIKYWLFKAGKLQYTRDKKILQGDFKIPLHIDWFVDENKSALPKSAEPFIYNMKIVFNDGYVFNSGKKTLNVNKKYDTQKYFTIDNGKKIFTYDLFLFKFNQSILQKNEIKLIENIKNKINKNSSIIITGYADNIGDFEYNKKLSYERAQFVYKILKNSTKNIILDNKVITNNSTPEERLYNRIVKIRVEESIEESD